MDSQSILDKASLYHDLGSLNQIRSLGKDDEKAALTAVARQFESFFLQEIFKNMRAGNKLLNEDGLFDSQQVEFFQTMHDEQMAASMASKSSFGIADLVVEQLTQKIRGAKPDKSLESVQRQSFSSILPQQLPQQPMEQQLPQGQATQASLDRVTPKASPVEIALKAVDPVNPKELQSKTAQTSTVAPIQKVDSADGAKNSDAWYQFDSPSDFINKLKPLAKKAAQLLGVSSKVLLAQAALETGWGKFVIKDKSGQSSFNLFNIKSDHRWDGSEVAKQTLEFEQGMPVKKVANFRAYQSFAESFADYAGFVKNSSRYQQAVENADNEEKYIESLHQAGYATDPEYSDKVKRILKSDLMRQIPD